MKIFGILFPTQSKLEEFNETFVLLQMNYLQTSLFTEQSPKWIIRRRENQNRKALETKIKTNNYYRTIIYLLDLTQVFYVRQTNNYIAKLNQISAFYSQLGSGERVQESENRFRFFATTKRLLKTATSQTSFMRTPRTMLIWQRSSFWHFCLCSRTTGRLCLCFQQTKKIKY